MQGVTLQDNVRSCEIRKTLNAEPLSTPNRETLATLVRPYDQNIAGRIGEASPTGYANGSSPEVAHRLGGVTTSPISLNPVFVWSQQRYLRLLLTLRYF